MKEIFKFNGNEFNLVNELQDHLELLSQKQTKKKAEKQLSKIHKVNC